MKEMSKFQLVLTGVFGACILLGVLIFSLGKFGSGQSLATVVVWGPLPSSYFSDLVTAAGLKDSKTIKIDVDVCFCIVVNFKKFRLTVSWTDIHFV